ARSTVQPCCTFHNQHKVTQGHNRISQTAHPLLISDLLYTIFQGVLEPTVIVSGDLFLIFSEGPIQNSLVLSIYCGLISMSFVIISFHFVFRAVVMSSKSYTVSHLDKRKMAFICTIFLTISIVWAVLTYTQFVYQPRLVYFFTIKTALRFNYERRLREYFQSINTTFPKDPVHEIVVFRAHGNSGSLATDILLTTIFVVVLVGSFHNSTAIEQRAKQRVVEKSSLTTFLIPFILLYTPSTVYLLAPFIGNSSSSFTTPTWFLTIILSIYPIIDPLAIIFLISDYRRAVFEMGRKLSKRWLSIHPLEASNSCVYSTSLAFSRDEVDQQLHNPFKLRLSGRRKNDDDQAEQIRR
ncbi:hypothetical protein PRIPAC_72864, partial [Pristionchus pacificus]|uniref:G protein-coupled receptor n=1 Tax=Pristionchus pacificus TaxID=54126 RepID=A0A2A6C701_PRIPA